jgi:NAD(P)-dependent dehydrogenase (short-subunit alcohol dehydrogenase family)
MAGSPPQFPAVSRQIDPAVIVTGGSYGAGHEIAREPARRDDAVVAGRPQPRLVLRPHGGLLRPAITQVQGPDTAMAGDLELLGRTPVEHPV